MEEQGINLFDTSENDIIMPGANTDSLKEEQKELISAPLDKVLYGKEVKTLILPEESLIQFPNYVLDFSECSEITIFQKEALTNLISKDGDVALYLYNQKSLTRFGYGQSYRLENLMALTKKHIFGDAIRIYRDVERDKPLKEVIGRDITKLRLNL